MSSAVAVSPEVAGVSRLPEAFEVSGKLGIRPLSGFDSPAPAREPAPTDVLPVLPELAPLLPSGVLRRGSTVTVSGSTALVTALLAAPSAAGAWCAVVGVPGLGVRSAAEMGVDLDRVALVPLSGALQAQWTGAVGALLDGIDVIVVRPPQRVRGGEARRLAARARERGVVLLALGEWEGADVRLGVSAGEWTGPIEGTGRLRSRQVRVRAVGRGAAARPRETSVWLPGPSGRVESVVPEVSVLPADHRPRRPMAS